jgi:hypothetical protein
MAKDNLSQKQIKRPKKTASQRAFQRLSWALQQILTFGNQSEINLCLQVAKIFAKLEFDPKTIIRTILWGWTYDHESRN